MECQAIGARVVGTAFHMLNGFASLYAAPQQSGKRIEVPLSIIVEAGVKR